MAEAPLSIKLRCASWQQLATIYRRDLSRGTMFLKASTQPAIGMGVRIDLELPSATVLELVGSIARHVVDPQRGTGVEIALEPLPTKTIWLIESALAAENKVRAQTSGAGGGAPPEVAGPADVASGIAEGGNVAEAETELVRALVAEAESLKKLNPFLVLGVGYEASDDDVRAAFGELTKRYHPDRFARYQSTRLRQIAAEIFILIRDAYRKLADDQGRAQVRAQLGVKPGRGTGASAGAAKAPPPVPVRGQTGPIPPLARVSVPPAAPKAEPRAEVKAEPKIEPKEHKSDPPPDPLRTTPNDAPTNMSGRSAAIASTELARPGDLATPSAHVDRKSGPVRKPGSATSVMATSQHVPIVSSEASAESSGVEALLDQGKLDDALAGYRAAAKKNSQDRSARAGVELVEGLRALQQRDRMEAAQRFEAALEIDPSNERAARELADMRRQATNERKGLLSRLMGKKEGPP